ncbi:DUF982 domain-containing protein [Mesorhizobium australafricanum]|uniref:DUF982 domain-containing protein n=1 Tax=Mesorhizobium australafricanum TaxID=3072311 RepID=A0ABU4X5J4_9HYPH|nr:DUF982 domain-containing protein [Mesorhizobium sp. VK3E]MDX8442956.1 DUF982 domain-containing protein [Mesorhizobium sp. VK3E]
MRSPGRPAFARQTINHDRFEEPVTILVGMGLPMRLETVMQAYALLQDWPAASRSSAHAIALDTCKAGIAGEIDPERSARPLLPSPAIPILSSRSRSDPGRPHN